MRLLMLLLGERYCLSTQVKGKYTIGQSVTNRHGDVYEVTAVLRSHPIMSRICRQSPVYDVWGKLRRKKLRGRYT